MKDKKPGKELPYKSAASVIGAPPDNQPEEGLKPGGEIAGKSSPTVPPGR